MVDIFSDYTIRIISATTALLGISSGVIGCFAVLRKESLIGDSISHAALPGIAIGYLLAGEKNTFSILGGAIVAALMSIWLFRFILKNTKLKQDTVLAIMLSLFFGTGLTLLSWIQKSPNASQAGLEKFLFGQAAAIIQSDFWITLSLSGLILALVVLFWKEFKVISFNPGFSKTLNFPVRSIETLLTLLVIIAIITGLQVVGVVLMSAMLVAPATAARQWTDKLWAMVILAGFFGAFSGVSGAVLSSLYNNLPTGPSIIIIISCFSFLSLLLSPHRGLLGKYLKQKKQDKKILWENVLKELFFMAKQHNNYTHSHQESSIFLSHVSKKQINKVLLTLQEENFVKSNKPGYWALSEEGYTYCLKNFKIKGDRQ